jgi:hypothetical protein
LTNLPLIFDLRRKRRIAGPVSLLPFDRVKL